MLFLIKRQNITICRLGGLFDMKPNHFLLEYFGLLRLMNIFRKNFKFGKDQQVLIIKRFVRKNLRERFFKNERKNVEDESAIKSSQKAPSLKVLLAFHFYETITLN